MSLNGRVDSAVNDAVEDGRSEPVKDEAKSRRRGAELETALLDAAWEELAEKGYDDFTYEGVATRASTSRAVVYRRWPTKVDLLIAAARHERLLSLSGTPDTGALRSDLRAVLVQANQERFRMGLLLMTRMGSYFAAGGKSPAELRDEIIGGLPRRTDEIWDRAIARGEADPARATPRVRALSFELFRSQLMMTLKPLPESDINGILDEVVLPLVRPPGYQAARIGQD